MAQYVVATVEEIPPGGRKIVEVAGRSIGVFNIGGAFFALRNRCPHQGGPLCQGPVGGLVVSPYPGEYVFTRPGEIVRCPWHGWEFDIRTGASWVEPERLRVRRYRVIVDGAQAAAAEEQQAPPGLERGPYTAEVYPVSVEQRRVIVEIPG
jgi:3-phenylpropionate/trans-cinnamate dioxygenase ferredoxin subunit